MLNANINQVYTANKVHSGVSKKGPWELIVLEGASNNDRLPIWVQNVPCNIVEGMKFIINVIDGVSIKHIKPNERYDKWQDVYSINAYVTPVEAES